MLIDFCIYRLEQELSLKASLVEMLRRDLEDVGSKLRAEEAKNRQLAAENQQLRTAAEHKQRQTQGKIFESGRLLRISSCAPRRNTNSTRHMVRC
jgi:hypothetical protein